MSHSHVVPFDEVKLESFVKVDHSPVSDVYLALSELRLECKPHASLEFSVSFWRAYASYGVAYRARRNIKPPESFSFMTGGELPQILRQLMKELPHEINLYLFGYQEQPTELPKRLSRTR